MKKTFFKFLSEKLLLKQCRLGEKAAKIFFSMIFVVLVSFLILFADITITLYRFLFHLIKHKM